MVYQINPKIFFGNVIEIMNNHSAIELQALHVPILLEFQTLNHKSSNFIIQKYMILLMHKILEQFKANFISKL